MFIIYLGACGVILMLLAVAWRPEWFHEIVLRRYPSCLEFFMWVVLGAAGMLLPMVGINATWLNLACKMVALAWLMTLLHPIGPIITLGLGTTMNFLVISLNGWKMPYYGAWELPQHTPLLHTTRLPWLADIFSACDSAGNIIGWYSIGDVLLVVSPWYLVVYLWLKKSQ